MAETFGFDTPLCCVLNASAFDREGSSRKKHAHERIVYVRPFLLLLKTYTYSKHIGR